MGAHNVQSSAQQSNPNGYADLKPMQVEKSLIAPANPPYIQMKPGQVALYPNSEQGMMGPMQSGIPRPPVAQYTPA